MEEMDRKMEDERGDTETRRTRNAVKINLLICQVKSFFSHAQIL